MVPWMDTGTESPTDGPTPSGGDAFDLLFAHQLAGATGRHAAESPLSPPVEQDPAGTAVPTESSDTEQTDPEPREREAAGETAAVPPAQDRARPETPAGPPLVAGPTAQAAPPVPVPGGLVADDGFARPAGIEDAQAGNGHGLRPGERGRSERLWGYWLRNGAGGSSRPVAGGTGAAPDGAERPGDGAAARLEGTLPGGDGSPSRGDGPAGTGRPEDAVPRIGPGTADGAGPGRTAQGTVVPGSGTTGAGEGPTRTGEVVVAVPPGRDRPAEQAPLAGAPQRPLPRTGDGPPAPAAPAPGRPAGSIPATQSSHRDTPEDLNARPLAPAAAEASNSGRRGAGLGPAPDRPLVQQRSQRSEPVLGPNRAGSGPAEPAREPPAPSRSGGGVAAAPEPGAGTAPAPGATGDGTSREGPEPPARSASSAQDGRPPLAQTRAVGTGRPAGGPAAREPVKDPGAPDVAVSVADRPESREAEAPASRPGSAAPARAAVVVAGPEPAARAEPARAERPPPSPPTGSSAPSPAHEAWAGRNAPRLAHSVRVAWARGQDRVELRLDPPHLGKVRIVLSRDAGAVSARFRVETPEAQHLLHQAIPQMREALEARGVSVAQVSVGVDAGQDRDGRTPDQGRTRRRRGLAAGMEEDVPPDRPAPGGRLRPWGFETTI